MAPDNSIQLYAEKTFSPEDQEEFALLSRDYNPMHMDAVVARRLITGKQVVHGVHVFLTALERWNTAFPAIVGLECQFANPVSVGDKVVFLQGADEAGNVILMAKVGELVCTYITLFSDSDPVIRPAYPLDQSEPNVYDDLNPLDIPPQEQKGCAYRLSWANADFQNVFPNACRSLGAPGVGAIAALSRFVGMVCPGLHSVFTSFNCQNLPGQLGEYLDFYVRRFDARFQSFDIVFRGALEGGIRAFRRPIPQAQLSMAEVMRAVDAGTYSGSSALVIGGSRGLGELATKILAAGGAEVAFTYAAGERDALALEEQIRGAESGPCRAKRLDLIKNPVWEDIVPANIDTIYYFATPRIFIKKAECFNSAQYDEFCLFYLRRFYELCWYLEQRADARPVTVYLPSTVYVAEHPKGLAEYAMAKAAAEVLAREINLNCRNVSVAVSRLPKLNTDQTASIFQQGATSNLDVVLDVVNWVQGVTANLVSA